LETREEVIHAWARRDEARTGEWTVGVKDIIDTADFLTEYGSPIYRGNQPRADAACVATLRAAGAVIPGKTVTVELAMFHPSETRNPHRITHTPGGSSSGSAAAVAAGHVDAALGTQTGGSVIRPASYCGVYGFKPSYGIVSTAGVKLIAPALDTLGWFARDVDNIERVWSALTDRPATSGATIRAALYRTEDWEHADADSQGAVLAAADALGAGEATVTDDLRGLSAEQPIVQAYESARSLTWERREHADLLSDDIKGILDWGAAIGWEEYDRVRARARRVDVERVFQGARVLITPAAASEAPEGLGSTGDPRFNRMWTLLGWPCMSVPGQVGATGMPVGVQLVGRPRGDAEVFAAARTLALRWG
jgi:Asp-tRNA(Asn)/Glu-tRNA(Gln) amidotransferase A subunit family amidase